MSISEETGAVLPHAEIWERRLGNQSFYLDSSNYYRRLMNLLRRLILSFRNGYRRFLFGLPVSQRWFPELIRLYLWLWPSYIFKFLYGFRSFRSGELRFSANEAENYLTWVPTAEGIGGQLAKYLTAYKYSKQFNLRFAHRAFQTSKHGSYDWNRFLGFYFGEQQFEDLKKSRFMKIVRLPRLDMRYLANFHEGFLRRLISMYRKRNRSNLFILGDFTVCHLSPNFDPLVIDSLRRKYWAARDRFPIKSHFSGGKIKLAVHVRRGDVKDSCEKMLSEQKSQEIHRLRYLKDDHFIRIISKINELFGEQNIDCHIYSDETDLEKMRGFYKWANISLHLKGVKVDDPFEAFHNMVISEILVCSRSAFSAYAGFIGRGIKIFPVAPTFLLDRKFFDNKDWIKCDLHGNFDMNSLILTLQPRHSKKARSPKPTEINRKKIGTGHPTMTM